MNKPRSPMESFPERESLFLWIDRHRFLVGALMVATGIAVGSLFPDSTDPAKSAMPPTTPSTTHSNQAIIAEYAHALDQLINRVAQAGIHLKNLTSEPAIQPIARELVNSAVVALENNTAQEPNALKGLKPHPFNAPFSIYFAEFNPDVSEPVYRYSTQTLYLPPTFDSERPFDLAQLAGELLNAVNYQGALLKALQLRFDSRDYQERFLTPQDTYCTVLNFEPMRLQAIFGVYDAATKGRFTKEAQSLNLPSYMERYSTFLDIRQAPTDFLNSYADFEGLLSLTKSLGAYADPKRSGTLLKHFLLAALFYQEPDYSSFTGLQFNPSTTFGRLIMELCKQGTCLLYHSDDPRFVPLR